MVETWRPETLAEALEARAKHRALPFAGGTDLMVKARRMVGSGARVGGEPRTEHDTQPPADHRVPSNQPVLFLDRLEELKGVRLSKGFIEIGSMVSLSELTVNPLLPPMLREVALGMAAPGIRNVATIGGNVCNASPAADLLPALYCFDAYARLVSQRRDRTVPIYELVTGPGATCIRDDEILQSLLVPEWQPHVSYWRKVGARKANALAKVSLAALAEWSGRRIARARLALGAVAPTVVRLRDAERMLEGAPPEELHPMLAGILACVRSVIQPIDDQRSTAAYRRAVAVNLVRDFVGRLAGDGGGAPHGDQG